MYLFIANIDHSLNIKQLHLLMGHYNICLHRREQLYINIVMTRCKTIVCQRESFTYFDAEFWEADVLPLPKKIIARCPQIGWRWGKEIVCELNCPTWPLGEEKEILKWFSSNNPLKRGNLLQGRSCETKRGSWLLLGPL